MLVGDGEERRALEALRDSWDLTDSVRFVGEVSPAEVASYYAACHLFLFPSTSEAQGLVVLEAMAWGLPVVAVRSLAVEDFVEDGKSGILTAEETSTFAAAVAELLRQDALRRRMGDSAREVARRFPSAHSAAQILEVYRRAQEARAERATDGARP